MTALSPALVWVGLKNSDDIGTSFDLRAEVYNNGILVGSGQLNGVPGGSSGFNNAKLDSIPLNLTSAVGFAAGRKRITNRDLQDLCPDVHPETLRRDLADLVSRGVFIKVGDKRATYYVLKK